MEDYFRALEDLTVKHRARDALRCLMAAGPLAGGALRYGLSHADPRVRVACSIVLDHYLDEDALPDLIANLAHPEPRVRARVLHTLACDRCKEGECRPAEDETIPLAIHMLETDPSPEVRRQAVGLLFAVVHRRPDACHAIERARDADSDAAVRKAARLRGPGGVMYLRTSPDRPRLRNSNARAHLSAHGRNRLPHPM